MAEIIKEKSAFNTNTKGRSGTEIYAGYIFEEYLSDIRGTKWAKKVDMMRRSDPIVQMLLTALKLPLLSQNWFIEKNDDSEEAEFQKEFFEKAIFEDLSDSFTKLLAEILTFEDFGYSLFEIIHGISFNERIGVYNTIQKLAFRSQKTIERFNVDKTGKLASVYQQAYGDLGTNVTIDGKFLVHFAPKMEGDNYEGFSRLRPCYGPWLRKNEFLKLIAAGLEKYAIPTPFLEVPELKENSDEFNNAIEALECYTSNQSQYLTFPAGWKLTIKEVNFDAEKTRAIIDAENKEMASSVMASFLLLGQDGSGSLALSKDLSDFFAQGLQASADHISEIFEKKIMKHLLDINFPNKKLLCRLRCDDLRGRADEAFANTMVALKNANLITADEELEDFTREKYKYPKKEREIIEESIIRTLAETKAPQLISDLKGEVEPLFKAFMLIMSGDFLGSLERNINDSKDVISATAKMDDPKTANHKAILNYILAKYSTGATMGMAREMGVKLSESYTLSDRKISTLIKELLIIADSLEKNPLDKVLIKEAKKIEAELAKLTAKEIASMKISNRELSKIRARTAVLVDTQASDIYKSLNLAAQSNYRDDVNSLLFEVSKSAQKISQGPTVSTGSSIISSAVINDARLDFSSDGDLGVESYTFVAEMDDSTSEICQALNGRTFSVNDPALEQYYPPLHHNCRSVLVANLRGSGVVINGMPNLTQKQVSSISLSECCGVNQEEFLRTKKLLRLT
jgi:hypothetical protein